MTKTDSYFFPESEQMRGNCSACGATSGHPCDTSNAKDLITIVGTDRLKNPTHLERFDPSLVQTELPLDSRAKHGICPTCSAAHGERCDIAVNRDLVVTVDDVSLLYPCHLKRLAAAPIWPEEHK